MDWFVNMRVRATREIRVGTDTIPKGTIGLIAMISANEITVAFKKKNGKVVLVDLLSDLFIERVK